MIEYNVFWIKEEFAYHYFYKSDILYRFIKSYQNNKSRQDLSSQYNYITNVFPKNTLVSHLHQDKQIQIAMKDYQLKIYNKERHIYLQIEEKYLTFYCHSLHDAEELLFPSLRLFHPLLFVVGTYVEDYGWITSIVKNNYKLRQVLYSYH